MNNKLSDLKGLANTVDFWGHASGWDSARLHETIQFALQQAERLEAAEARIEVLQDDLLIERTFHNETLGREDKLNTELARRDKDAGEPIYQQLIYGNWSDCDKGEYLATDADSRRKLFAAAQPAVLPPEVTYLDGPYVVINGTYNKVWAAGANWMREQAKALGAQPKVAE